MKRHGDQCFCCVIELYKYENLSATGQKVTLKRDEVCLARHKRPSVTLPRQHTCMNVLQEFRSLLHLFSTVFARAEITD